MSSLKEIARDILFSRDSRHRTVNLFAFLFNLTYIFFNLVSGIVYENILSVTVAAYYSVTVYIRYLVIGDLHRDTVPAPAEVRLAASLIFIMAFPISGIIFYTVIMNTVKKYPVWILVILAVYSAAGIIRAQKGLRSAFSKNSEVKRTAYTARLSAAMLSLFNLSAALPPSHAVRAFKLTLGILIPITVFYLSFTSLKKRF